MRSLVVHPIEEYLELYNDVALAHVAKVIDEKGHVLRKGEHNEHLQKLDIELVPREKNDQTLKDSNNKVVKFETTYDDHYERGSVVECYEYNQTTHQVDLLSSTGDE
jgi:hypothetical protein